MAYRQKLRAPMGVIANVDTEFGGYLIKRTVSGEYTISKNGAHICYAIDVAEAIRTIRENLT